MIRKLRFALVLSAFPLLFFPAFTRAQKLDTANRNSFSQRIRIAPESVFKMFRAGGMKPVNHKLTQAQHDQVNNAFALLPPLHQRILKQHLHSISFMDNMPNTALTSPVGSGSAPKLFNITFRAGLLDENISQWASIKENTCFKPEDQTPYKVHVVAGNMDALVYVLTHEATHIVDAVLNMTPHPDEKNAVVEPTLFTGNIWRLMNMPADPYIDSLLEQTRFRSGKAVPASLAPEVYQKLSQTPFPSLYATAAWFEDIAELATIYHLTNRLNQPFYVIVTKDNAEIARFEPMKNMLVTRRLDQLKTFYVQ